MQTRSIYVITARVAANTRIQCLTPDGRAGALEVVMIGIGEYVKVLNRPAESPFFLEQKQIAARRAWTHTQRNPSERFCHIAEERPMKLNHPSRSPGLRRRRFLASL